MEIIESPKITKEDEVITFVVGPYKHEYTIYKSQLLLYNHSFLTGLVSNTFDKSCTTFTLHVSEIGFETILNCYRYGVVDPTDPNGIPNGITQQHWIKMIEFFFPPCAEKKKRKLEKINFEDVRDTLAQPANEICAVIFAEEFKVFKEIYIIKHPDYVDLITGNRTFIKFGFLQGISTFSTENCEYADFIISNVPSWLKTNYPLFIRHLTAFGLGFWSQETKNLLPQIEEPSYPLCKFFDRDTSNASELNVIEVNCWPDLLKDILEGQKPGKKLKWIAFKLFLLHPI